MLTPDPTLDVATLAPVALFGVYEPGRPLAFVPLGGDRWRFTGATSS